MAQEAPTQSPLEIRVRALWGLSGRDLAAQAWKWPKEERAMLANEFKAYLESGKFGKPEGHEPFSILVRLGDREATQKDVQKMLADGLHLDPGFGSSGSPIAIEYLAPYAFSQEPYEVIWGGDVGTVPLSFKVTGVVFQILSDSSAFTGEVISWARRTIGPDPERQRAELQRWWEENKIHFEREDYKAVKPGRPIPNVVEVIDESRRKAGLPPLNKNEEPKPDLAGTRAPAAPVAAAQNVGENGPLPGGWALWGGIAAVLAAVAGWLWLRSKGKKG